MSLPRSQNHPRSPFLVSLWEDCGFWKIDKTLEKFEMKTNEATFIKNVRFVFAIFRDTHLLVMSPSWSLARSEPGHFNFRAETELTIPTIKKSQILFNSFFPQVFIIRSPVSWFQSISWSFIWTFVAQKVFYRWITWFRCIILSISSYKKCI